MTAFDTLIAHIGPSPRRYPIERGQHGATIYGPWRIHYDPPPIPARCWDWQWAHDDYDGAEDAGDSRSGACATFADALNECDEWEDDNAPAPQPEGVV